MPLFHRELHLMPIESAVFKMTGLPAAQIAANTLTINHANHTNVMDMTSIFKRATDGAGLFAADHKLIYC